MAKNLKEYFNSLSDILATEADMAGNSSENIDIGTNREVVYKGFLLNHVPSRYAVSLGGHIFGVGQKPSGQIDIIINHDMSMNFSKNYKIQSAIESVTAAVSIKTKLDKNELFSALNNLASIPQCHSPAISLSPLKKSIDIYILSWPALFIFAFDGLNYETLQKHFLDFYTQNNVPINRVPRAIIVNQKYILTCLQYEIPGANATTIFDPKSMPDKCLRGSKTTNETRGHPILWMMIELSKGLSWLDGMYLNYAAYYDEAYIQK